MRSEPYQRFSKTLRKILEENNPVFVKLGDDIDTIGSHLARKSAAT